MIIAAIVITDLKNGIGKNNQLLCHLPADLKFFKDTTMGCPVIMGRKTYESVGRLLPGRRNLIITRSGSYKVDGADIFHSVESALKFCTEEIVFIVGGAEIYKSSMNLINVIYRTIINHTFDADAFFQEVDKNEFKLTWEEPHQADIKNPYDFRFQKWERIK